MFNLLELKSNQNLIKYKDYILELNEQVNLTAITDENEFFIKHFYDSLLIMDLNLIKENDKIIDIGTGAGFPGMPLAFFNPNVNFTLLDSLAKRVKIINSYVKDNNLNNVIGIHNRAEILSKLPDYREKFDIVITRAVANLSVILEYAIPFLKVGGYFIAYKGPSYEDELSQSKNALKILGAQYEYGKNYQLPNEMGDRNLLIFKKISKTDFKFPRESGLMKKKPL
jgi:16S rRNA (guanine527-N7)-methyltransferase